MNLYQRLTRELEQRIRGGVLRAGERLPSVRQACRSQRLSPATVLKAYYELESRGLVEARPRLGYFVRPLPREAAHDTRRAARPPSPTELRISDFIFDILESVKDPAVVPLGSSFASPHLFPLDKLGRCLAAAARHMDPRATVTDLPPGNEELIRQIALRYLRNGVRVEPAEIVVTSGAMEALNLCLQAVTRPGDLVVVESPTFYAALQAAERLGLRVVEVPTHPTEGVDLGALAQVLEHHPVRACLLMLNFHSPTGALMPDERRGELAALLRRHRVPLIEDDTYAELHFGRCAPLALKSLDTDGLILHVSSFSKCLAPGYRVGWVAAGRFARTIQRLKLSTSLATTVPVQIAIADFLRHGAFDAHLRRLRTALRAQEAAMAAAVERHFPAGTRVVRPRGGYLTWVELPPQADALALYRAALERGISIAPGPIFSAKREYLNCMRLNFGHAWTVETERAVATLGELVAEAL